MVQGGTSERGVKVRRGLESLRSLDPRAALKEFAELAKRYPANSGYQASSGIAGQLVQSAKDLDAMAQVCLEWRRTLRRPAHNGANGSAPELAEQCLRASAAAIATRAEEERGPVGEVGGVPVARLWVEAGDAARARACAESAMRERGELPVLLVCLANAYSLDPENRWTAEARDLYRRAFVDAARAIEPLSVVDGAVRDLFSLAETEYEVPGEPEDWIPTVGFLERVLPIAHIDSREYEERGAGALLAIPAAPEDARSFYHYLRVSESCPLFGFSGESLRIESRKRLKSIAPHLYAKYLKRF
jgi:hypothetical protein